jgi:hypothetical protein
MSADIDISTSFLGRAAVLGDHLVRQSISGRLSFLRFEQSGLDEDGIRIGVFLLVDRAPEHEALVEALS